MAKEGHEILDPVAVLDLEIGVGSGAMVERSWQRVSRELVRLRLQRERVLALHLRRDTDGRAACGHCSIVGRRGDVPVQLAVTLWPCPTVQALGGVS